MKSWDNVTIKGESIGENLVTPDNMYILLELLRMYLPKMNAESYHEFHQTEGEAIATV